MNPKHAVRLYLTDINAVGDYNALKIPEQRREKSKRYRMPDDKKRCLAAGALLERILPGAEITENEYGKPVCAGGPCFNLSHSGSYVLLAVSPFEVGCDIETVRQVSALRMGEVVFCGSEMALLRGSADKTGVFFDLWTKKEALLKCIGKGFHRPAKTVDVSGDTFTEDGTVYYFKTVRFSDCTLSVCSVNNGFGETEFIKL